jgi:hypothetical protein
VIDLLIPLEIPSHNELNKLHWSTRHKIGKMWEQWIRYTMRNDGLDVAHGKRHVEITAYRKRRIPDEANLIAGANKTLVDAMVRAGLLVDDCDKLATFAYAQDVGSKSPTGLPCTRIILTDLP